MKFVEIKTGVHVNVGIGNITTVVENPSGGSIITFNSGKNISVPHDAVETIQRLRGES